MRLLLNLIWCLTAVALQLPLPCHHRPALERPRVAPSSICAAADDTADLGLTPALEKVVTGFKMVPDVKLRYQQLLFLAKKLEPMDAALAIESNKVPGCLSVVYVVGSIHADGAISYVGDSDSQLTKGLAALLINGLSGCTSEQIQAVNPKFIQAAGLAQSLTPGRNNGFVNMLALMKRQAALLAADDGEAAAAAGSSRSGSVGMVAASDVGSELGPVGRKMTEALAAALAPVQLEIIDESAQHAGHAGAKGLTGESHFALRIVSDAFEGVRSLQRHKMVYAALEEEMQVIHALSIKANTPAEVA